MGGGGGGIRALRTRKSIILYHSGSTPAFSCSSVTCLRWPSSLSHANRQSIFPCSSVGRPSSGEMGIGNGGGKRGSAIIGKLGLKLFFALAYMHDSCRVNHLRKWRRVWNGRSAWTCVICVHSRRRRTYVLCMGVVEIALRRAIVSIWLFRWALLRRLALLLADTVHPGAGINVVVDGPIGPLASVGEWPWDFLEAWVQRKVMANRIL